MVGQTAKLTCRYDCSLMNMKRELELYRQLLLYVFIQIQKAQRRCSRAKPRPLRRAPYAQTQTANHSPQKKQRLQVGLPNLLLMMPENFRGWTKYQYNTKLQAQKSPLN